MMAKSRLEKNQRVKKHHPILRFFGIFILLLVLAAAVLGCINVIRRAVPLLVRWARHIRQLMTMLGNVPRRST